MEKSAKGHEPDLQLRVYQDANTYNQSTIQPNFRLDGKYLSKGHFRRRVQL